MSLFMQLHIAQPIVSSCAANGFGPTPKAVGSPFPSFLSLSPLSFSFSLHLSLSPLISYPLACFKTNLLLRQPCPTTIRQTTCKRVYSRTFILPISICIMHILYIYMYIIYRHTYMGWTGYLSVFLVTVSVL